jgi:hypothetical protein
MHAPHLFQKEEESVDPEHLAYIAHVKKILNLPTLHSCTIPP